MAAITGASPRKVVVAELDHLEDQAPPQREAERQKQQCAADAAEDREPAEIFLARETERDRNDDPADGVVDDRRGKDDLADIAAA
jgi:hypothetical protein